MRWLLVLIFMALFAAAADELPLRGSKSQDLLVLNTGRVVRGHIVPRTNGYDVTVPGGHLFIGSDQVRFRATDMEDAYQKMRDSFVVKTPQTHMRQARWCLDNKLLPQARREVLDALHLDPERLDAKRMLQSLTAAERHIDSIKTQATTRPADHKQVERRSLGGLPSNLAADFAARIQPLVSNKCGNTQCHGGDKSQFQIYNIRRGITAATSEQNLAAIMNQIDLRRPETSPLLQGSETPHGGQTRPLFQGQSGRKQLQALRSWVQEVARDSAPGGMDDQAMEGPSVQQISFTEVSTDAQTNPAGFAEDRNQEAAARRRQRVLQEAKQYTRPDAFNPDLFNLKYHGRTRLARTASIPTESTTQPVGSQPEATRP